MLDGAAITGFDDNPFAHGAGPTGFNLGVVKAGATVVISYLAEAQAEKQNERSVKDCREDQLHGMKTQRRGDVHVFIGMVKFMPPPQKRNFVVEAMPQV